MGERALGGSVPQSTACLCLPCPCNHRKVKITPDWKPWSVCQEGCATSGVSFAAHAAGAPSASKALSRIHASRALPAWEAAGSNASPLWVAPCFKALAHWGGVCIAGGNTVFVVHPFQRDFVDSDLPFITMFTGIGQEGGKNMGETLTAFAVLSSQGDRDGVGGGTSVCLPGLPQNGIPCLSIAELGVSSFPSCRIRMCGWRYLDG